jgi:hypothetical protein
MNALVKVTIDEIRAALRRISSAGRLLKPDEFIAALRDSPLGEELLAEQAAERKRLREQVIAHRDAAPAQAARELKSRVAAYETARAELDRIEAERRAAQDALARAQVARDASAYTLRQIVDSDNLLLEQTADPVIDLFIEKINREWQDAHTRVPFTVPTRFVRPSDDAPKKPAASQALRMARDNPRLLTVVPTDEHAQVDAYMDGLRAASGAAEALKLTALAGAELLDELARIESRIPHRDVPNIAAGLREGAKGERAVQGRS